jgi:prolyl-tRNA synthetase
MGIIAESLHDDKGLVWPRAVAPFNVHLVELPSRDDSGSQTKTVAQKIYLDLQKQGLTVLYDDRKTVSAGEKFKDSDLIGIPTRLVVSAKTLEQESVEVKKRDSNEVELIKIDQIGNSVF